MPDSSETHEAFRIRIIFCLLAAASLALFSCASVPENVLATDPSRYFSLDADAYLKLSGRTARDMSKALGQERLEQLARFALGRKGGEQTRIDRRSMDSLLSRTRSLGMGISRDSEGRTILEAAIVGDFSAESLPFAFALNGDWKRESADFIYRGGPLRVTSPTPGVMKLGSSAASLQVPPATGPARTIPPRHADAATRDFALWLDNPGETLGTALLGETLSLPVMGMLVIASRETADLYVASVIFQFRDEAQARLYRPVMRFLWTSAADRLFGPGTASFNALSQEGDLYAVRHMTVSLQSLATLVSLP